MAGVGRSSAALVPSGAERSFPECRIRRRAVRFPSDRCRTVPRCPDGPSDKASASETGAHGHTAGEWRRRFPEDRPNGLSGEARSERPRTAGDDRARGFPTSRGKSTPVSPGNRASASLRTTTPPTKPLPPGRGRRGDRTGMPTSCRSRPPGPIRSGAGRRIGAQETATGRHAPAGQSEVDVRILIEGHDRGPKPFKRTKSADDTPPPSNSVTASTGSCRKPRCQVTGMAAQCDRNNHAMQVLQYLE